MSYGGVNNIFLFNQGKSRPAKDALFKLGGILTSSEELMQAAAPIVNSAINATTPPMTPPSNECYNFLLKEEKC